MNTTTTTAPNSTDTNVTLFQWLLILGFPTSLAAAKAMPEVFRAEDVAVAIEPRPFFRTAA